MGLGRLKSENHINQSSSPISKKAKNNDTNTKLIFRTRIKKANKKKNNALFNQIQFQSGHYIFLA